MSLNLYNSLSKQREKFIPHNSKKVSMYVCGPTVYDRPHIGNIRSIVIYDTLFRILQYLYGKEQVLYVRNITDVDDKINNRALERNISIDVLTAETIEMFNQDTEYLNCKKPSIEPKATQHIDVMIDIIQTLLNKGIAYQREGYVFFDISKYDNYGKLSGRKLEDLIAGSRVAINTHKKNLGDFILWKPADTETPKSAIFDSPFGAGRPGWHIECSAMSYKYLGENFDIHGGGADLMFPHHTNEIAQSCCAFDKSSFAKYWVHNGFLTYNGDKMSKSLGNIVTIEDFRQQKVHGSVIRLMLLSSHYRKPMDFNDKLMHDSQKIFNYLQHTISNCTIPPSTPSPRTVEQEFIDILCEDLNTPKAISYLHNLAKQINSSTHGATKHNLSHKLLGACNILGVCLTAKKLKTSIAEDEIQLLIEKRKKARTMGMWEEADQIRQTLLSHNVVLEDVEDGKTIWSIK